MLQAYGQFLQVAIITGVTVIVWLGVAAQRTRARRLRERARAGYLS